MCGIAGIIGSPGPTPEQITRIDRAIAHRGPDDRGTWCSKEATLIHRRLSILDLKAGHQPMVSEDEKHVIIFNGEIYNYPALRKQLTDDGIAFRTHCDTEVLLHLYQLYGKEMVHYLRGMFAFALWDREHHQALIARDHMGQKPLYYSWDGKRLIFASEIKAILAVGNRTPELDVEALWHYTSLRFCPGESTLFKNIKKLTPGSLMQIQTGKPPQVEKYWEPDFRQKLSISFDDAVDMLDHELNETVADHLLSDVPLGCFLSGGIDSSLVAHYSAKNLGTKLPTFSIGVTDADFSELRFARQAADIIGTEHHEFTVKSDLFRLLPTIIWHLEEAADPHAVGIYQLSKQTRRFVKVALGGEGGDELFGGYTRFLRPRSLGLYKGLPIGVRNFMYSQLLRRLPESFSYYSVATKARWFHEMSFLEGAEQHYHAMTFFRFSEQDRAQLFRPEAIAQFKDISTSRFISDFYNANRVADDRDRCLYAEQRTHLAEHFLLIADRTSMAHGLEVRVPILDLRLVELAARLPAEFKVSQKTLKRLPKALAYRHFPRELIDRPKQGFAVPLGRWFRGELQDFVRKFLMEARLLETGILNAAFILSILDQHAQGKIDHSFRIWYLINLEIWYRLFCMGETPVDLEHELLTRLGYH